MHTEPIENAVGNANESMRCLDAVLLLGHFPEVVGGGEPGRMQRD